MAPVTAFSKLMGIEIPILQAAIWPATSPELVAAVGEAGAIGSVGAVFEPADALMERIALGAAGANVGTRFLASTEASAAEAWKEQIVAARADELRGAIMGAIRSRRAHELTPFTGQTAGLVADVLPAGEIVRRMAADACAALRRGAAGCA